MSTTTTDTCPRCGSTRLFTVRCTDGPHHARTGCSDCAAAGRPSFLRWEPAPMTFDRAVAWTMPFGKHAGEALGQIGSDPEGRRYLAWLRDNAELKPNARSAIETFLGGQR